MAFNRTSDYMHQGAQDEIGMYVCIGKVEKSHFLLVVIVKTYKLKSNINL